MPTRILYAPVAAGTALTNSTTHTVLASYSLPANALQVGKIYRVTGGVIATATNSTDTLLVKVLIGGTTLTGDILATSGAVDVANDNVITFALDLVVRSGGIVIATGFITAPGAAGTGAAVSAFKQSSALTTTSAVLIECTGTWSAASASDSCRCDAFNVIEIA